MDVENKDDVSWFDKDLDEFDVRDNGIEENSEDEKDLASMISAFVKTLCKHKTFEVSSVNIVCTMTDKDA